MRNQHITGKIDREILLISVTESIKNVKKDIAALDIEYQDVINNVITTRKTFWGRTRTKDQAIEYLQCRHFYGWAKGYEARLATRKLERLTIIKNIASNPKITQITLPESDLQLFKKESEI